MSKAREIKAILEGFKLGKLGAGKAKLAGPTTDVPQPSQDEPLTKPELAVDKNGKRIYNVITSNALESDGGRDVAAIKWKETGDMRFLMICVDKKMGSYVLQIFGGKGLKLPTKKIPNLVDTQEFALFRGFSAKSRNEAEQFMWDTFHDIPKVGSLGYALATGKLGPNWKCSDFHGRFIEYLFRTSNVVKSSYVTVT
jgi:hypothetical protein